jgi:hypothetical protein
MVMLMRLRQGKVISQNEVRVAIRTGKANNMPKRSLKRSLGVLAVPSPHRTPSEKAKSHEETLRYIAEYKKNLL